MVAQSSTPPASAGGGAGQLNSTTAAAAAQPQWWTAMSAHAATARKHLSRAAADLQAASKTWKAPDLSKGLKVQMDFLSPAVSTVKSNYAALPEPVREVLPFAGVAAVTGFAVSSINGHRYRALQQEHQQLTKQLATVEAQMQDWDSRKANAHVQVQMAEAVAQATNAAAAAATAAATAAAAAAAAAGRK